LLTYRMELGDPYVSTNPQFYKIVESYRKARKISLLDALNVTTSNHPEFNSWNALLNAART
jgi:hypothetical protein